MNNHFVTHKGKDTALASFAAIALSSKMLGVNIKEIL